MDLRRLEHLLALADTGQFVSAAQKVHLSQAAFSRSIQSLEEDMGVRLFDRGRRGAVPTQAGHAVIGRARQLIAQTRSLEHEVALIRDGGAGLLRIGCGPLPAFHLVPCVLAELRKAHPLLEVSITVEKPNRLMEQLETDAIDLLLADIRFIPDVAEVTYDLIGRHRAQLYCRKGHPLLKQPEITIEDATRYGVALMRSSQEFRNSHISKMNLGDAVRFPMVLESEDGRMIARITAMTDMLAILPELSVGDPYENSLCRLSWSELPEITVDIHAISRRGRSLSPTVVKFIEIAKNLQDKHIASNGGEIN